MPDYCYDCGATEVTEQGATIRPLLGLEDASAEAVAHKCRSCGSTSFAYTGMGVLLDALAADIVRGLSPSEVRFLAKHLQSAEESEVDALVSAAQGSTVTRHAVREDDQWVVSRGRE